jgi:hypothetical protein
LSLVDLTISESSERRVFIKTSENIGAIAMQLAFVDVTTSSVSVVELFHRYEVGRMTIEDMERP